MTRKINSSYTNIFVTLDNSSNPNLLISSPSVSKSGFFIGWPPNWAKWFPYLHWDKIIEVILIFAQTNWSLKTRLTQKKIYSFQSHASAYLTSSDSAQLELKYNLQIQLPHPDIYFQMIRKYP